MRRKVVLQRRDGIEVTTTTTGTECCLQVGGGRGNHVTRGEGDLIELLATERKRSKTHTATKQGEGKRMKNEE